MPKKFLILAELMRLHTPTGYLLSFFPASFGLLLAYEKPSNLLYLLVFFIGSVLARGAGCVVNDLLDRNLDQRVERTKGRPISSGRISIKEALLFLFALLCACLGILLSLTVTSIVTGFIAFFLILLYPLMKRITYFPQAFLGITFNLGCLIGYASIKDDISPEAFMLYIACGFWTLAYDTIYAFMDIKDDKKVGIKSTAIFFENMHYKLAIAGFYGAFYILFLSVASSFVSVIILLCAGYSSWIVITLDVSVPKNCLHRFKANNYIGFVLFLGMVLENI